MKAKVPITLLKRLARNYGILAARGVFDRRDTKVANALRLAAQDTAALERHICRSNENGKAADQG